MLENGITVAHQYASQHFNSHNFEAASEASLHQQNERLAKTLQLLARRYSDLFEASLFGCVVTDTQALILQANTAACTLLHTPHKTLIGKRLADYLGTDIFQQMNATHEILLDLPDGQQIYLQVNVRQSGDQLYWQFCDLTAHWQREQAERERLQAAAVAAERERLARDLHDSVTQTLFSASVLAETLPRLWKQSPERVMQNLEALQLLSKGALAEMRTLLFELHPQHLKSAMLREQFQHLANALRSRKTVEIALAIDDSRAVPDDVKIAFYRIAQEAFNNIRKHSAATQVQLIYRTTPDVELIIRDNGIGFDITTTHPSLGLHSMSERAEAIGADFRLSSFAGRGTQIAVLWTPVDRSA
jgi:signal transduction histidine kinase